MEANNHYWTLMEAVELCRKIEEIAPKFGCHVALTGGTLYKDGKRKDLDLLFYRIRQVDSIDKEGLFGALGALNISVTSGFGWLHKAVIAEPDGKGSYTAFKNIDLFFPEEDGGGYYSENKEVEEDEEDVFL